MSLTFIFILFLFVHNKY